MLVNSMPRHSFLTYAVLLALVALNSCVWFTLSHPSPPRLTVSVLDIGQGDSILVQGPTGDQMLVDGGPIIPY